MDHINIINNIRLFCKQIPIILLTNRPINYELDDHISTTYILYPITISKLKNTLTLSTNVIQNTIDELYNDVSDTEQPPTLSIKNNTLTDMPKILIIDDAETQLWIMEVMLNKYYIEIHRANSVKVAYKLMKKHNFAVIFTDIKMQEESGIDFTIKLRKEGYKLPIIGVTALTNETDDNYLLSMGMNNVITKPVKKQDLVQLLQKYINVSNKQLKKNVHIITKLVENNVHLAGTLLKNMKQSICKFINFINVHGITPNNIKIIHEKCEQLYKITFYFGFVEISDNLYKMEFICSDVTLSNENKIIHLNHKLMVLKNQYDQLDSIIKKIINIVTTTITNK